MTRTSGVQTSPTAIWKLAVISLNIFMGKMKMEPPVEVCTARSKIIATSMNGQTTLNIIRQKL